MNFFIRLAAIATFAFGSIASAQSPTGAPSITPDQLAEHIEAKLTRVPEFKFIMEQAKADGIRVWLFGGTAAAFAHYAKLDYLRQHGDTRFQPERFDYDYTNIYRSNQDLDIVVDAPAEIARKMQQALSTRFPHLQGEKGAWEVRTLKTTMGEKEALLDNPDFLNQHTDSHSVGMIELSESNEPRIRDLRDWKNSRPSFLQDVALGKLHYYFSGKHETTSRFKAGKNPPILSVIRYFIKAFQFELEINPSDEARLREIIQAFDPAKTKDAPLSWMQKNAPKLYQNAVNIEYASIVLERFGLLEKLRKIDSPNSVRSASWWLSKEPLRSFPVGGGKGKTARELGIDVVAHETSDIQAFESITRAHTGDPNVFISRNNATGEAAVYGNGFYTAKGKRGARGTNITIRFNVDPNARLGTDFILGAGDEYVIFQNKSALRVIAETLNIGFKDYFRLLIKNQVDVSERAKIEKLKRRLSNSIFTEATQKDIEWLDRIVRGQLSKAEPTATLISEWLKMTKPYDRNVPIEQVLFAVVVTGEKSVAPGVRAALARKYGENLPIESIYEIVKDWKFPHVVSKTLNTLELRFDQGDVDTFEKMMMETAPNEKLPPVLLEAWVDSALGFGHQGKLKSNVFSKFMANSEFQAAIKDKISNAGSRYGQPPLALDYAEYLHLFRFVSVVWKQDQHSTIRLIDGITSEPEAKDWSTLRPYLLGIDPITYALVQEMKTMSTKVPKSDVFAVIDKLISQPSLREFLLNQTMYLFKFGNLREHLTVREVIELVEKLDKETFENKSYVMEPLYAFEWQKKAVVTDADKTWLSRRISIDPKKAHSFDVGLWLRYVASAKEMDLLVRIIDQADEKVARGRFDTFLQAHGFPLWAAHDQRMWDIFERHAYWDDFGRGFDKSPFKGHPDLQRKMVDMAVRKRQLDSLFRRTFTNEAWKGQSEVLLLAIEKAFSEPLPSLFYRLRNRKSPEKANWDRIVRDRRAASEVLRHTIWSKDASLRELLAKNRFMRRFMTAGNLALAIEAQSETASEPALVVRRCEALF